MMGRLALYNAFPRIYRSMNEASADLERIANMGFNAVWLNPLNLPSNAEVVRYNPVTDRKIQVKGSLYATYDFSLLNSSLFQDVSTSDSLESTGDPRSSSNNDQKLLRVYTDKARSLKMEPIFDLVLNHVAKDSSLAQGTCPHFLKIEIDTKQWFVKDVNHKWDDIVPFNYEDEKIRKEIIDNLWKPYIEKYVKDFGFMGIRVDFATGISIDLQKELFPWIIATIKSEFKDTQFPIVFAECLPPKGIEEIALNYRGLYTHVTNNTCWLLGNGSHDIGTKQQLTHLLPNNEGRANAFSGTIGFAASHDDGPNAWNAMEHIILRKIAGDKLLNHFFHERAGDKKAQHEFFQKITYEKLSEMLEVLKEEEPSDPIYKQKYQSFITERQEWIKEQKKRIAICAFVSEGGYYLLSGDEFGDSTPRQVFSLPNGKSVYDEAQHFNKEVNVNLVNFIMQINQRIAQLPSAKFESWSKLIALDEYPDLLVVISYNGRGYSDSHPILNVVNLADEPRTLTKELLEKIAHTHQTQQNGDQAAFTSVMTADVSLINSNTQIPLVSNPSIYQQARESYQQLSSSSQTQKTVETNPDSQFDHKY